MLSASPRQPFEREHSPGTGGSAAANLETPSGKWTGTENFPVASRLLPARLRPHVLAFYAFARAIDDIADNPALSPQDKLDRLDRFEAALVGRDGGGEAPEKALRLRASLAQMGVTPQHGVDLLAAFKQDAVKLRYDDWDDLMGYCIKSASPVGRFLLDLHGEDRAGWRYSDALCNALQVINHLQDCRDDYLALDRVYLPGDWMAEAGCDVKALAQAAASAGLRRVLDRTLDGVERLLEEARSLPAALRSRGLALESGVIVVIAERLARRLRRRDPLASRVKLTRAEALGCAASGVVRTLLGGRRSE